MNSRLYSPVGTITRQATQDVELAGERIPKGDLVAGVLRSANLDERRWTDPTKLDIRRAEGGHAAFALGQHRCLGEWLGRQEVAIGTARLFARLPSLRLQPDEHVELYGFEFRGPRSLKVQWDV
ncbi:MAG: cytochrome P450 [Acidobacteria bacterium]|nr:MAG: cytochrome P450 [Acidobacteriota bacterium]